MNSPHDSRLPTEFWSLSTIGSPNERLPLPIFTVEKWRHEHRLMAALTAARMVAWTFDFPTRSLCLTENATTVLGLPKDFRLASSAEVFSLIHPEDVAGHCLEIAAALKERRGYISQFRIIVPGASCAELHERRMKGCKSRPSRPCFAMTSGHPAFHWGRA